MGILIRGNTSGLVSSWYWQKSYLFGWSSYFLPYSTLWLYAVLRIVLIFIGFFYRCITVCSLTTVHCSFCSNPVVQVKAMEEGALQSLLTTLATTQLLSVKKKVQVNRLQHSSTFIPYVFTDGSVFLPQVLFAVASLLRHFPFAQQYFLSHGGLQVLSELFKTDGGGVLRSRIVTILHDMISEKVQYTLCTTKILTKTFKVYFGIHCLKFQHPSSFTLTSSRTLRLALY